MSEKTKKDSSFNFDKVIDAITAVGSKIGNQRQMSVLKDSFSSILPLIIVGSVALLFNTFIFSQDGLLSDWVGVKIEKGDPMTVAYHNWKLMSFYISPIFNGINSATMGFLALYVAFLFGYFTFKSYGDEGVIFGGMISLAAFFLSGAVDAGSCGALNIISDGVPIASQYTNKLLFFGGQGIILAIIFGLTAPVIAHHLMKIEKFAIKMPDGVPPSVGASFGALIPVSLTIIIMASIQPLWGGIMYLAGPGREGAIDSMTVNGLWYYFPVAINTMLATPLQKLSDNFAVVFLLLFCISLFWFFGLHGSNIMAPVLIIVWLPGMMVNQEIYNAFNGDWGAIKEAGAGVHGSGLTEEGAALSENLIVGMKLHIWTYASTQAWGTVGGGGYALGLVITSMLFSKNPANKTISRIGFPPACFNISEPMVYGLPIMLNPYFMIPFLFTMPTMGMLSYFAISLGIIHTSVVFMPWATPPFILQFFNTGADWRAIIWMAISITLACLMYIPWVFIENKAYKKTAGTEEKA